MTCVLSTDPEIFSIFGTRRWKVTHLWSHSLLRRMWVSTFNEQTNIFYVLIMWVDVQERDTTAFGHTMAKFTTLAVPLFFALLHTRDGSVGNQPQVVKHGFGSQNNMALCSGACIDIIQCPGSAKTILLACTFMESHSRSQVVVFMYCVDHLLFCCVTPETSNIFQSIAYF